MRIKIFYDKILFIDNHSFNFYDFKKSLSKEDINNILHNSGFIIFRNFKIPVNEFTKALDNNILKFIDDFKTGDAI